MGGAMGRERFFPSFLLYLFVCLFLLVIIIPVFLFDWKIGSGEGIGHGN